MGSCSRRELMFASEAAESVDVGGLWAFGAGALT
jgi:hypothetical protein